MSGAVVVMLLIRPLVIRPSHHFVDSGVAGHPAGSVAVMALLGLTARLTATDGRPTLVDDLES
jgi:hypothetical protein